MSAAVKPEPTTRVGGAASVGGGRRLSKGCKRGRGGMRWENVPEARTRYLQWMSWGWM